MPSHPPNDGCYPFDADHGTFHPRDRKFLMAHKEPGTFELQPGPKPEPEPKTKGVTKADAGVFGALFGLILAIGIILIAVGAWPVLKWFLIITGTLAGILIFQWIGIGLWKLTHRDQK